MARGIDWRWLALVLCAEVAHAQWPDPPVRMSGQVTIWVVQANPDPQAVPVVRSDNSIPKKVQEKTVGEFTPAATAPNPASTGKALGGFGVLSTEVPNAGADAPAKAEGPRLDPEWQRLASELEDRFRDLRVKAEPIYDTDLADRLEHPQSSNQSGGRPNSKPDLLISIPAERARFRLASDVFGKYCVRNIWPPDQSSQVEQFDGQIEMERRPELCILALAPNAEAARGVAVWFSDRGARGRSMPGENPGTAANVAADALRAALTGQELGIDSDSEIAGRRSPQPAPRRTRTIAKGSGPLPSIVSHANPGMVDLFIDAAPVLGNDRLALVALRAMQISQTDFGVAHAMVVLRKDSSGSWRVLQISPYLLSERQRMAISTLEMSIQGKDVSNPLASEGTIPMGISQAAPLDGDTRIAPAEMWWDNLGGASLQVVEWQTRQFQNTWLSHLFLVPDDNSRLKTRITARFAADPGQYRWRVWSVGVDGTVVLSPWRTLTIVGP